MHVWILVFDDDVCSQLKSPGLVTMVNGKNRTLYMSTVQSIEAATKPNLKKTLRGTYVSTYLLL